MDLQSARCKTCRVIIKTKFGSTSAIHRHLRTHPEIYEKLNSTSKNKNDRFAKKNPVVAAFERQTYFDKNAPKAKELTKAIAEMIAIDLQPYSVVEDPGFKRVLKTAEPRYRMPCRTTFSRDLIPKMYKDKRCQISQVLQKEIGEGKSTTIGITTDGWTSRNIKGYMTLTIHYITSEFENRQFLLNLSHVSESHTSQNLCEFIKSALSEWELLDENITLYFTTDNAPNIVKAISLQEQWHRIPCFAHTLQLAIKNAIKECPELIQICKKCKSLVGFFARSSTAKAKFEAIQKSTNSESTPLNLIQDVETRWNSTHDMLSRILLLRMPLGAVLSEPRMPDNLTGVEWNLVKIYVDALQPFKEATVVMSGEDYPTISLYIPIVSSLIKSTKAFISENDGPEATKFGNSLLKALESRFNNVDKAEELLLAMLVDPRYKNRLLDIEKKRDAEELLLAKHSVLKDQEPEVLPERFCDTNNAQLNVEPLSKLTKFLNVIDENSVGDSPSPISVELRDYLAEKVMPQNTNIVTWWRNNKQRYPGIAIIARSFLALPATQVSSERVFSVTGNIVTATRANLLSEHVEELCFLHANLKI